jgi:glycosyltransferase involved in cell wall biosynthesis
MAMFVAQSFRYSFKLGKRFDVELFHAHWTIPAGLVALIASRLLRKPFVVSSYGSDLTFASREPLSRAIISVVLKRVNHFIGLSKELDTIAKELGVPAPRATIIPDGVRPELFAEVPKDRTEIRKHLQLGNGPVVLYVGRLDKMKGLQYLLEAMTLLSKAFSKRLTLLIVGDGPEKLHLKQLAESASYRTRFVGPVPHTQIPEILSIADVCVLPSMSEGLSSFLEEAMFAGRPIVATCVGGTPDIISSGVNGLLVDPADSVELSQAIRRILSNRTFAQQLGRNARKFAEENLTTETTVHSILSIYQRVANKPL